MLVVVVSDAILMMIIMMVMVIIAWLEDVRCSVVKSSVDASQDFSTGFNHVGSEGELLTVEHKEISVFLKGLLAASALLLQSLDSVLLLLNFVVVL